MYSVAIDWKLKYHRFFQCLPLSKTLFCSFYTSGSFKSHTLFVFKDFIIIVVQSWMHSILRECISVAIYNNCNFYHNIPVRYWDIVCDCHKITSINIHVINTKTEVSNRIFEIFYLIAIFQKNLETLENSPEFSIYKGFMNQRERSLKVLILPMVVSNHTLIPDTW